MQNAKSNTGRSQAPVAMRPISTLFFAQKAILKQVMAASFLLLFALGGCISNKRLVYLQDENLKEGAGPVAVQPPRIAYKLNTGDVVNFLVKGVDAETATLFNTISINNQNLGDQGSQYMNSFSVGEGGEVVLPTIGRLQLRGLTVTEAEVLIQKKLNVYLKDATAIVKLASFKITVLGEVKRNGYYYIPNSQCTIFEGLGQAGDLTSIGNRTRIKIIRTTNTGTEVALLDITKPNIITSPYYYLHPNDVLYVEPLSGQTARANLTPITIGSSVLAGAATITLLVLSLLR